jgi:formate dehydrogenase maturation protein FdhE
LTSTDRAQLILQRLAEAEARDPDLRDYYAFHQTLFRLLNETKTGIIGTLELVDHEALDARVLQGLPLLSFNQLPIEADAFAALATTLAAALADYEPELAADSLPADAAAWISLAEDRFKGGQVEVEQKDMGTTVHLANLATDLALRPHLEWAAEQVLPHLNQERWKREYCPVCGGSPDLALLMEESGARHLVCSRCNSQWLYRRLGCPFCDTTDHTKISYYPSDDELYRLYVCQACQRYLKTIDLRQAGRRVLVEVERITTIDMDAVARQEGYH